MVLSKIASLIQYAAIKYLLITPILSTVALFDYIFYFIRPKTIEEINSDPAIVMSSPTDPTDPNSPYRSTTVPDLYRLEDPNTNLYSAFESCVKKYAKVQTFGVRQVFDVYDEVQPNGKIFKKYKLGKYQWSSYEQVIRL
jgi:hypothetical protein